MLQEVGYSDRQSLRRTKYAVGRAAFSSVLVALEVVTILLTSAISGICYHLIAYGVLGPVNDFLGYGLIAAAGFVIPLAYRGAYMVENYLDETRSFADTLSAWTYAILGMTLVAFLAHNTDTASRGWILVLYGIGLAALAVLEDRLHLWVGHAVRTGRIAPRRLMLVGDRARLSEFMARLPEDGLGLEVAISTCLPPTEKFAKMSAAEVREFLKESANSGRVNRVGDVVLLLDPNQEDMMRRVTDGLMDLPSTIHLGGWFLVDRFPGLRADRIGRIRTLTLVRSPLSGIESATKRLFDVVLASIALVLVSPILMLAALAIKLDTPGPVIFRQRRRGFNQQEFRIWKFRTMNALDDGDSVIQATDGDARITRVGAFLRRTNVDELPQLFNVLTGEMSLVGPRPHAIAHDRQYEQTIDMYARRLNVKPGITGWAQVNGRRGPTVSDDAMRERLLLDLHYIDNWSLGFDLLILLMTIVSPRAYRNAL